MNKPFFYRTPNPTSQVSTPRQRVSIDPTGVWANATRAERNAIVMAAVKIGEDAATVAKRVGATTVIVRGHAHRLGLVLGYEPKRNGQPLHPETPLTDIPGIDPSAWTPIDGAMPVSFADNDGCMWPVMAADGTEAFCGRHKHKGAYCGEHAARASGRRLAAWQDDGRVIEDRALVSPTYRQDVAVAVRQVTGGRTRARREE